LCPIVLYGRIAVKRAQETGAAESTLDRKADAFDEQGMVSLFAILAKDRGDLRGAL